MVEPGSNSDAWIAVTSPITNDTAIASPSARPSPSTTAAPTPDAVLGSTMPRITSHRVGAERRGAVLELLGTVRNRSRLSAEMIGRIITRQDDPGGEDADPDRLTPIRTAE